MGLSVLETLFEEYRLAIQRLFVVLRAEALEGAV